MNNWRHDQYVNVCMCVFKHIILYKRYIWKFHKIHCGMQLVVILTKFVITCDGWQIVVITTNIVVALATPYIYIPIEIHVVGHEKIVYGL